MRRLLAIIAILALIAGLAATARADVFDNRAASSSAPGIVELATDAETITGLATDRAVTPANLRAVVIDAAPDAALSGTPVILSIKAKDGSVYYFKAYPTKTAY